MVSDKDGRTSRIEIVMRVFHDKGHTCGEPHYVFEGAGGGPLCDAVVADGAEEDGDGDTVAGADYEGDVGGEEAGEEAGEGEDWGEHVED